MKRLLSGVLATALAVAVLPGTGFAIEENDPQFDQFLTEINWDKTAFLNFLESKEWDLEEFDSVDELGTPLNEAGIQEVLNDFGLTRAELNELLVDYGYIEAGEDVTDSVWIIFNEDLYWEVEDILVVEEDDFMEEFFGIFSDIGLTEEELERLFDHLSTLDFESAAFESQLNSLLNRMAAFEDFSSASELSAAQVAEILDVFNSLLNLFEMDATYSLVKDGVKQSVSLATLVGLESVDGADLLIEFYNKQGTFLADILLTADMFGSDIIKETGRDIKEVEKVVVAAPVVKAAPEVKTVKGGKLPKTASSYATNAMAGLALAMAGFMLFRRFKIKEAQ